MYEMSESSNLVSTPQRKSSRLMDNESSPLISRYSTPTDASSESGNPKRFPRFALFAACLIPFGAYYAKQSLPPLRPFFEKAGTSSYNFGLLLSAAAWPNLFQVVLAGLFIDSKGHEQGAILFTTLALFGHAFFAASTSPTGIQDDRLFTALAGRAIFGLGSGGSGVVQGAIIGEHFEENLSFAVGFTEGLHYLAKWLGRATPVSIAKLFGGNFIVPLWVGCFALLVSCIVAVAYVLQEELHKPFRFALHTRSKSSSSRKRIHSVSTVDSIHPEMVVDERSYIHVSWGLVYSLPMSFWAVAFLHMLFSNTANLYSGFSTSYMVETFGLTPEHAAWIASIDAFLPIFISPIVGRYVDKHGGRFNLCAVAAVVDTISFGLLIFIGSDLPFGPIIPALLISFSTSTTPMLVKSCIPVVAPKDALGTAFSLYLGFEGLGASIGHAGLGYLRDSTSSYTVDLAILMSISMCAFLTTFLVARQDRLHYGGVLNKPSGGENI